MWADSQDLIFWWVGTRLLESTVVDGFLLYRRLAMVLTAVLLTTLLLCGISPTE